MVGISALAASAASAALFVPSAVFCIETLSALLPARHEHETEPEQPFRLAVLIPAHDEEGGIEATVRALRSELAPGDRILVVADNCSDRTAAVAAAAGAEVVERRDAERRGKGHALNRAVAAADCDVLVLSDANNFYSPDSIRRLVARLREPGVGGATGAKKIVASRERAAAGGDGLYWRYESKIKTAESALGGTVTADGEIFALRKQDYREIPASVINDDMYLTFRLVDQHKRVVYEPEAVATEEASITIREDFNTKVRMIAGGMQSMRLELPTIFSSAGFAVKFLSHKLLRWLMPLVLLTLLATSAALALPVSR